LKIKLGKDDIDNALVQQIEQMSGETIRRCYQCGNCTGGCPVSYAMDIPPSQIMRFLQLGRVDDVLAANSMWTCVGCLQCFSRCPQSVSVANTLEGLRQLVLRKGIDHERIEDVPLPMLKSAPQQAIVCGFRKFVS
jgi:heterodisulfide reductase subunit C